MYLSISICLSIYPSIYLSNYIYLYLSIYICAHQPAADATRLCCAVRCAPSRCDASSRRGTGSAVPDRLTPMPARPGAAAGGEAVKGADEADAAVAD